MHYRMSSSIPGLHVVDAIALSLLLALTSEKCLLTLPDVWGRDVEHVYLWHRQLGRAEERQD